MSTDASNGKSNPPSSPAFPAYYDSGRKNYWIKNARDGWIEVNETGLRRQLKAKGYFPDRGTALVSPLDEEMNKIQVERDVAYAGALAGHNQGVIEEYGNRILVTTAPKLIEPKQGDFGTITAVLVNLFHDQKCDQLPFLYGWLKIACESLISGSHRPG